MKKLLSFLFAILLVFGLVASAGASPILVTDRGALGGTDSIVWDSPNITGSSFTIDSVGGKSFNVSMANQNSSFYELVQGSSWSGNFAYGDKLLYTGESFTAESYAENPIMAMSSSTDMFAGGAQIQANYYGYFTAKIEIFDSLNNSLGSFTENGVSGYGENNAIFIGVESDVAFNSIAISIISNDTGTIGDFAINKFDFKPVKSIPEPAALFLLGSALIGLASLSRKFTK